MGEYSHNLATKHSNKHSKEPKFEAQMETVFKAFYEQPKTMLMVSVETGVLRANLCRYVATWRKSNRIGIVKADCCKITQHVANYLTTNSNLIPKTNQLQLFKT